MLFSLIFTVCLHTKKEKNEGNFQIEIKIVHIAYILCGWARENNSYFQRTSGKKEFSSEINLAMLGHIYISSKSEFQPFIYRVTAHFPTPFIIPPCNALVIHTMLGKKKRRKPPWMDPKYCRRHRRDACVYS